MTKALHNRRSRTVSRLGLACGALAIGLVALNILDGEPRPQARIGQPVFPGLASQFEALQRVEIILPDERYTLQRDGTGWGLAEFDLYPVRPDALADLFDGLAELSFEAPRTTDPAKYARIGVGDPEEGGLGAKIRVYAENQESALIDTMVGRRGERDYLRFSGRDRAWLVTGDLPPFYAKSEWVDLESLRVKESQIRSVDVSVNGESYRLERAPDGEGFSPAAPTERLVSRFSALGPALALSRWSPVNVRRERGEVMETISIHRTTLEGGTETVLEVVRDSDGANWVRTGGDGPGAQGWLYQLAPQDMADLMTPRGAVLRDLAPPEPASEP